MQSKTRQIHHVVPLHRQVIVIWKRYQWAAASLFDAINSSGNSSVSPLWGSGIIRGSGSPHNCHLSLPMMTLGTPARGSKDKAAN